MEDKSEPGSGSQEPNLSLKLSYGFAMASQFGTAVLGGLLAGGWLDRHFHLDPWGTLGGAILGMGTGLQGLLVLSKRYQGMGSGSERDRERGKEK